MSGPPVPPRAGPRPWGEVVNPAGVWNSEASGSDLTILVNWFVETPVLGSEVVDRTVMPNSFENQFSCTV